MANALEEFLRQEVAASIAADLSAPEGPLSVLDRSRVQSGVAIARLQRQQELALYERFYNHFQMQLVPRLMPASPWRDVGPWRDAAVEQYNRWATVSSGPDRSVEHLRTATAVMERPTGAPWDLPPTLPPDEYMDLAERVGLDSPEITQARLDLFLWANGWPVYPYEKVVAYMEQLAKREESRLRVESGQEMHDAGRRQAIRRRRLGRAGMVVNRRSFFGTIAAAFAPLRVAAALPAASTSSVLPKPPGWLAYDVIHHAARLLGVIVPGEVLGSAEFEAWSFHLSGLLAERRWASQSHLARGLAERMSPIYPRFPRLRFHPHAFVLTWPRLG